MAKHPIRGLRRPTPSELPDTSMTPSSSRSATDDPTTHRRTRPGRGLPNGRAVVGGLLVTVAAVAVFGAYARADAAPTQQAVMTRGNVPLGHRLTNEDLVVQAVTLPPGTAAATFTSVDQVVGAITLAALGGNDLVQRSAVHTDGAELPAGQEFSFPVDRERAVDGDLEPGEKVDVLATYGSGQDSYTAVLTRRATVVAVQANGRSALGGSGSLVLTLALSSGDEVLDVAHAAQIAQLTVVRATRSDESETARDRTTAAARSTASAAGPSGSGS